MDRILIDGFPRSGNIFCNILLVKSFPNLYVSHFTHSVKALTSEHFVLIRNPQSAISSFMSVFQESDVEACEKWWLRFYRTAVNQIDVSRFIFFDDLVFNTSSVVNKISQAVNTEAVVFDYTEISKNQAQQPYKTLVFPEAQDLYETIKSSGVK